VSKDEHFVAKLPISVARRQWRQVIRLCKMGPVLLTRCGEPLLVVLSIREYQALRKRVLAAGEQS
jgi:prevent-host-death family protein